jgi:predicted dehydrogenase
LLRQSAIGDQQSAISIRAHWGEYLPAWHPWEDYRQGYAARPDLGGGVILTLCHPFDYLRWLFGECEVAWALKSNRGLGMDVEDSAEIGLKFASGLIGSVHLDYVQRPAQHTLEIVTRAGAIRWDNADGSVQVYAGEQWQTYPAPAAFERNTMFLDQMRHFLAVCRGEAEPLCTLQDGVRALELALKARECS